MDLLDATTVALIVLATFDWIAVVLLTRAARRARRYGKRVKSLEDRGRTAAFIAVAATLGTLLGINRHLQLGITPEIAILMLVALVLLPSLANLIFLLDLWRGKFG